MKKPIILGMNRNERRVDIKFKRNIDFIKLYLHLLNFLKIDYHDEFRNYMNFKREIDKEYFFEQKKDTMDWFKEDFTFEIFFGVKNVFIVFESNKKMQQKFIDEVCNLSKWFKN